MTTTLTPMLLNDRVNDQPLACDIYAWRGDTFHLPLTFIEHVQAIGDAVLNGTTSVTSAVTDPEFVDPDDVGRAVIGEGIPFGATIASVVGPHEVTLSDATDASGGVLQWGDALDVSLWTFAAQVRVVPDSQFALATFSWDTSAAATGCVIGTIDATAMAAMPSRPPRLAWDLQVTASSEPRTLLAGAFVVGQDVTR